jgi:hypothetical protein
MIRPLIDPPEVTEGLVVTSSLGSLEVSATGSSQNSENVPRSQAYCEANEDVEPAPARCP